MRLFAGLLLAHRLDPHVPGRRRSPGPQLRVPRGKGACVTAHDVWQAKAAKTLEKGTGRPRSVLWRGRGQLNGGALVNA